MSTAERLAEVRGRIARAAERVGRSPGDVLLVAVSKAQSGDAIREAYAAGQRAFGENYAQELDAKAAALADLTQLEWHFIGHLQSNKAKTVSRVAHVVHSVDGTALARELGRRAAAAARGALPVFVEVNVGDEPQKHGVAPPDLAEVVAAVNAQPALRLRGLMTMPPADDRDEAKRAFETLVTLRNLHGGTALLPDLSMGMSSDFELAIECGATVVRVGTAIFGPRG